jgi:hypothetical protein
MENSSVSSDMRVTVGGAERYMVSDNTKKYGCHVMKNNSRQLATYDVVMY